MSHRDWDALECCWGDGERAEYPSLAVGPSKAWCRDAPYAPTNELTNWPWLLGTGRRMAQMQGYKYRRRKLKTQRKGKPGEASWKRRHPTDVSCDIQ